MKGITNRSARTILNIGSSALALALPVAAQAQDAPQEAAEEAAPTNSEIIVTGSRVRGEAPVGAAVTALGRKDIETSSAVTVDRMIREVPQVFDLGVSENSRGQSGGSGNITYGNSVNLRGIGPYATLIIVDGHRVTNNSRSIDPSTIPSLGVERIEIIADGASAIYGSDAVAISMKRRLVPRWARCSMAGRSWSLMSMSNDRTCRATTVISSPATSASPAVAITGSCAAHRAISMPTARLMQSPLAG